MRTSLNTYLFSFFILLISLLPVYGQVVNTANEIPVSELTDQLQPIVPNLDHQVLQLALLAYDHAKLEGYDTQGILTIIDYVLPSTERRMWVIDIKHKKLLYHILVAHGKNSGALLATRFSDKSHSLESSIGTFVTGNTYHGKHGLSLRMIGLDKGFNDLAYKRAVVIHSAWYVSPQFIKRIGRLGRSWGCPALNPKIADDVIEHIKNGTVLFAYYPKPAWLHHSAFLQPIAT